MCGANSNNVTALPCLVPPARGKIGLRMPDDDGEWFQGALVTMIGMRTDANLPVNQTWDWVLEKPPALPHADLYAAMKATRTTRLNQPCPGPAPDGCF